MVRVSPGSPSKKKATRSPWPASTWRSRQLYAALSVPSAYHLANGGLLQSNTSVGSRPQVSRFACSSQKPSKSDSACRYVSAVTFAFDAKSFGGGNRRSSCSKLSSVELLTSASLRRPLTPYPDGVLDHSGRSAVRLPA